MMNSVDEKHPGRLCRFQKFLQDRLDLKESGLPVPSEWSDVANTICALALRRGLLSWEQAEQILEIQVQAEIEKRAGEIAVELGYLTPLQVDRLLEIQELNKELMFGQQLVLCGILDLQTLMVLMGEFLGTLADEQDATSEATAMTAAC